MSLLTSLISYWKCDEASGNLLDSHGANPLTQAGSVGTAAGKVGTARDFPGTAGNYFSHADNADLSAGDTDWTFACWLRADALPEYKAVAGKGGVGSDYEWVLYSATSGQLQCFFRGPSADGQVNSPSNITTGTWHHVALWHDSVANLVGICLNAGTAATVAWSTGIKDLTGDFFLGRNPTANSNVWDGRLDEVGWWRRVLTPAERVELYNGGAGFAYPFSPPATTVPALSFPGAVGSFPGLVFPGGW